MRSHRNLKTQQRSTSPLPCPLAMLYYCTRNCCVCTRTKQECEFLYSTTCSHVFCKECILKMLEIHGTYKCMLCRTPTSTFIQLKKENLYYKLEVYRPTSLSTPPTSPTFETQPSPNENEATTEAEANEDDDIASLIEGDAER